MILLTTIQRCLSDLEGRDKMMKIIQYSFKVLLFHQWVDAKRWSAMVSHLSQTRKLLRVGKWIDTLLSQTTSYIVLGNRVADDLFCFYKLGVVGPGIGKKAERLAMYCWFLNICIDLKSTIMSLQQKKLFLTQLSCVKLVMDALFCACDIWKPTPGIQAWSGFFSGCLAGYKHWCTK
ncbi:hypothetical protein BC941DRAFT_342199 [Chlamydoabsidia padenii]|nr:hypothetical protein BC941DRAFT_342199 [Chlamydoabsidia padenii]